MRQETALHIVSRRRRSGKVAQLLLEGGADINIQDKCGHTALDIAERFGRREIIQLLRRYMEEKESQRKGKDEEEDVGNTQAEGDAEEKDKEEGKEV